MYDKKLLSLCSFHRLLNFLAWKFHSIQRIVLVVVQGGNMQQTEMKEVCAYVFRSCLIDMRVYARGIIFTRILNDFKLLGWVTIVAHFVFCLMNYKTISFILSCVSSSSSSFFHCYFDWLIDVLPLHIFTILMKIIIIIIIMGTSHWSLFVLKLQFNENYFKMKERVK